MIVPLFVGSGKRVCAVLTPKEDLLIYANLNDEYKIRVDFLRESQVRIAEAYWLVDHPECFRKNNGAIFLPNVEAIGKKRCTIKNRTVILSTAGIKAVERFFAENVGLPSYQAMESAIRLAAKKADFDLKYITTKMYRKTMISWLKVCYPELGSQIQHSAGHNYATMQGHYITYGFRKEDISDMRTRTAGFGEGA